MDTTVTTSLQDSVYEKFQALFNGTPLVVRSPGRVNLIGEHTDYNNGLVLPAAIDKNIIIAVGKRDDHTIQLHSLDQDQSYTTTLATIKQSSLLWPDYILGVVQQLQQRGHTLQGFDLVFGGDIPQGAGLSSSAALECATAFALNELFALGIQRLDIALIGQAAENEFVGVKCGLMDQFASVFGQEQRLIKLDCADFSYEYIPFNNPDLRIVLFDTQVKHSLASSAYNERREQCEYGVSLIQKHHPEVKSLRDATFEQLNLYVKPVDEVVYNRCLYVVSEIQRLQDGCEDLKRNDFTSFGKRMFETHDGLQHHYEVSCDELDILVDLVRDNDAVLGARMMGGGFGGCTINLVKADQVQEVIAVVTHAYAAKTGKTAQVYVANISAGTNVITG
ncbi:galactokinase [Parapedobacter koreensis]|uniref:Galactokinase n=1 Tax=Parapedobacter koreensis TaxID=332977 RepID=A0A1H7GQQ7_9SPHI|nr:galactokinase [Parapedobacter koreensis]SEK40438.1 galactokinase [Parapedobacter koreensis]